MPFEFVINGRPTRVDVPANMPLLWVIRDVLNLRGTKYGCGVALCGACTVHINGEATRSCITPISEVAGKKVTTIEGLSADLSHPVQKAWIEVDVPQCGYCQSGQIMSAAALLAKKPRPTDAEVDDAMSGIICRCGTYQRIREAIHRAAQMHAAPARQKASPVKKANKPGETAVMTPHELAANGATGVLSRPEGAAGRAGTPVAPQTTVAMGAATGGAE